MRRMKVARRGKKDPKVEALRAARTLNPRPEAVRDEQFGSSEFFDARDLVQVKYEMVRRVQVDGASVVAAAAAFGFSRPSYYEAAAALAPDSSLRPADLVEPLHDRFGVRVHPRSIERGLARRRQARQGPKSG